MSAQQIPAAALPESLTWQNLFRPSPDPALLAAEEEIANLRAQLTERDADAALLDRVLREVPWLAFHVLGEPAPSWPPRWLRQAVVDGRANALQEDRALVAKPTPNIYGACTAPVPMPATARWFRHAERPQGFDPAAYASARRVLARCESR